MNLVVKICVIFIVIFKRRRSVDVIARTIGAVGITRHVRSAELTNLAVDIWSRHGRIARRTTTATANWLIPGLDRQKADRWHEFVEY